MIDNYPVSPNLHAEFFAQLLVGNILNTGNGTAGLAPGTGHQILVTATIEEIVADQVR